MKNAPTPSRPPKKSAPKAILALTGVIRSQEAMAAEAMASALARAAARVGQALPPEKDSYTLKEAVRYLVSRGKKYSERTLQRYVNVERIKVKRTPGKHIRFPKSALDALP